MISILLCIFNSQDMLLDEKNPWYGILASTKFALKAMLHTSTVYTSAQLDFGHDSTINQRHDVDFQTIGKQKEDLINRGNKGENHYQIKSHI